MSKPTPQRCRSCGASIYWATSDATGRAMIIDAEPVSHGNVLLTLMLATGKLSAQVLGKDAQVEPGRNRYTSHHATCPNADQHRRRARG